MATLPKPVRLGPFLGINNKLPADQLSNSDDGAYVRDAVNVDLTAAGTFQRRPGHRLTLAATAARSLWTDGMTGYFAEGARLMRFDGTSAVEVAQLAGPTVDVSFTKTPRGVVWSDGTKLQLLDGAGSRALSVPVPNPVPVLAAGTDGSVEAGLYHVALAHVNSHGERSALLGFEPLTVAANGAITVTLANPAGLDLQIFVSPADAEQLYLADVMPAGATSQRIPLLLAQGEAVEDDYEVPMPPGTIVRHHRGRLLSVVDNGIYISEAYSLGICRLSSGYVLLDGPITLCEPVDGGVYIATASKTWFAPGGDFSAGSLQQIAPFGAVPNSVAADPKALVLWWSTSRGAVKADASGGIELVQDSGIAFGTATNGASIVREENGLSQLVSVLTNVAPSGSVSCSSYMEAEVVN
jgi:hypothetical protein